MTSKEVSKILEKSEVLDLFSDQADRVRYLKLIAPTLKKLLKAISLAEDVFQLLKKLITK